MYTYILLPDTVQGFTAEILELPGCYAEGETANDAIEALQRAAAAWICAAQTQRQPIPPPLGTQDYAGKIALCLPKSLHRQVVRYAHREGVSLNQFLVAAIAEKIGAEVYADGLKARLLAALTDSRVKPMTLSHGEDVNDPKP